MLKHEIPRLYILPSHVLRPCCGTGVCRERDDAVPETGKLSIRSFVQSESQGRDGHVGIADAIEDTGRHCPSIDVRIGVPKIDIRSRIGRHAESSTNDRLLRYAVSNAESREELTRTDACVGIHRDRSNAADVHVP